MRTVHSGDREVSTRILEPNPQTTYYEYCIILKCRDVFSSKLYSDKIFVYSLISIFFILLLTTFIDLIEWFTNEELSDPLDHPVFLLYVISLPISLGLFFYSMACLYSYRSNIEPWGEDESKEFVEQSTPANTGISVAAASKLKEAKELLDQGIIDDDDFQKIKDEYFPK